MQTDCMKRWARQLGLGGALLAAAGCPPEVPDGGDASEVISRVTLSFTPTAGGEARVFAFTDPDGDGGMSGMAETITLAAGVEYTLTIGLENSLSDPPVDIGAEVGAEAEEHMIFIVGDVAGPASLAASALVTHAYADRESDYGANEVGDDLPLGLEDTITATTAGEGTFRVILRHLPPVNDVPQKSAALPMDLAEGRELPGSVDVDVSFALTVE